MEPTNGREWRAKRRQLMTLPSGNVAEVRRPSLVTLALNGDLPDFLTSPVMNGITGKRGPDKFEVTKESLPQLGQALAVICKAALVSPRVVDDEIGLEDIDSEDQLYLLNWVFGRDGAAAARFPDQPVGNVGLVPDGAGVRHEAVKDVPAKK